MVVNFVSHQNKFDVSCITVSQYWLHRLCLQLVNNEGHGIVKLYDIICDGLKPFINSTLFP